MNGMLTHRFSGWSSEDLAVSHSFHHEFAPAAALCELSLTSASENDDQAGTNLGFLSYTYTDSDGTPHELRLPCVRRRSRPDDPGRLVHAHLQSRLGGAAQRLLLGLGLVTAACRHRSFPGQAKRPGSQARS